MSDTKTENDDAKEALKKLKAARKNQIAAVTTRMKEQRRAIKAIKEGLQDSELTVPDLAAATGLDAAQVLWYVATLKKYGEVLEGAKEGGYYRYRLNPAAAPAAEAGPED